MPYAYVCRGCKGPPLSSPPENGRCPNCLGYLRHDRKWVADGEVDGARFAPIKDGEAISMADLMAGEDDDATDGKFPTGSPGVDHVFVDGLPKVGAVLISAKEGLGKTTWLWGLMHLLADRHKRKTLYISSEQASKGLKRQFRRLDLKPTERMIVLTEADADAIYRAIEREDPDFLVLDSVHDVEHVTDENTNDLTSGQSAAVTRVAKEIRRLAEEMGFFAFLVGHMNNDGVMAGGSHLRHEVDGTLTIEPVTTKEDPRRILQFEKYRLGPIGHKALLVMGEKGMTDRGPWHGEKGKPKEGGPAPERPKRQKSDEPGQVIPIRPTKAPADRETDEPPDPPAAA